MDNPNIEIVSCKTKHIREMAIKMNAKSAEMAFRLGMNPKKALWQSYKQSLISRTIFVNGEIAAIFGISGIIFEDRGRPWLIMAPIAEDYPFRVAFMYRSELKKMQEMFPILEDYVSDVDEQAIRMLELMGFKLDKEKIPVGDAIMLRAERRAI